MLTQALTDHFRSYFNRAKHHDTILWLDSGREYAVYWIAHLPSESHPGIMLGKSSKLNNLYEIAI